jgi:hypothetical protein
MTSVDRCNLVWFLWKNSFLFCWAIHGSRSEFPFSCAPNLIFGMFWFWGSIPLLRSGAMVHVLFSWVFSLSSWLDLSSFSAASSFHVGFSCRGVGLRAAQSRPFRCWFSLHSFLQLVRFPGWNGLICSSFLGQQSAAPDLFSTSSFSAARSVRTQDSSTGAVRSVSTRVKHAIRAGVLDLWLCSFSSALVHPPLRFFGALLPSSCLHLESATHPRIWCSWCLLIAVLFRSPAFLHWCPRVLAFLLATAPRCANLDFVLCDFIFPVRILVGCSRYCSWAIGSKNLSFLSSNHSHMVVS